MIKYAIRDYAIRQYAIREYATRKVPLYNLLVIIKIFLLS